MLRSICRSRFCHEILSASPSHLLTRAHIGAGLQGTCRLCTSFLISQTHSSLEWGILLLSLTIFLSLDCLVLILFTKYTPNRVYKSAIIQHRYILSHTATQRHLHCTTNAFRSVLPRGRLESKPQMLQTRCDHCDVSRGLAKSNATPLLLQQIPFASTFGFIRTCLRVTFTAWEPHARQKLKPKPR